jgi:hypothetical protein
MNEYLYEVICVKIDSEMYNLSTILYFDMNSA